MALDRVLVFDDVSFAHQSSAPLFVDLSFEVQSGGQILFVLGPSGSGKTSILYLILGLNQPTCGDVHVTSSVLPMFQQYERMLLPWLSVRRNVEFGLTGDYGRHVKKCVEMLEIEDVERKFPKHTSGGQRQRAMLARALARRPRLLVLDEPFSSVDRTTTARILPRVRDYLKGAGISVVWVTHDPSEAAMAGDQILVLRRGGQHSRILRKPEGREISILASEIGALLE